MISRYSLRSDFTAEGGGRVRYSSANACVLALVGWESSSCGQLPHIYVTHQEVYMLRDVGRLERQVLVPQCAAAPAVLLELAY